MTAIASTNVRNRVGDLTLQTFGTGPFGTLTPTASGGAVSFPAGYQIVFAVGGGEARIARLQQGISVPASNNDVVYAVVDGQEITAIEAAVSVPAGSQVLGTASGTPVDTFTQSDRAGGIQVSGAASAADPYALFQEQQASGVQGGTFTSGAWRTRLLNTEVVDSIGITLASNQLTLEAGVYRFSASAPARIVGNHTCRLQNITEVETILVGEVCVAETGGFTVTHSRIEGEFELDATNDIELQHRCATTRATDGFGEAGGFPTTVEVYSSIALVKVA